MDEQRQYRQSGCLERCHETDDKGIQAIRRHSNVQLTQNIYIKSVDESQVDAMDTLSRTYNDLATSGDKAWIFTTHRANLSSSAPSAAPVDRSLSPTRNKQRRIACLATH